MSGFVVFFLHELRLALPVIAVERIVQAVCITPLPDAPRVVSGVIDVHGKIIPVVDMHRKFGLPSREIALNDRLIVARTATRTVAFVANAVPGVIEYPESALVKAAAVHAGLEQITGVVRLDDGLVIVHDLDRLLSLDEEEELAQVLTDHGGH